MTNGDKDGIMEKLHMDTNKLIEVAIDMNSERGAIRRVMINVITILGDKPELCYLPNYYLPFYNFIDQYVYPNLREKGIIKD
jgi:hypothetical protein